MSSALQGAKSIPVLEPAGPFGQVRDRDQDMIEQHARTHRGTYAA